MQGSNSKWESSTDVTSIPGSSPPRSPLNLHTHPSSDRPSKHRHNPSYIVQSPSQFDGDSFYYKSPLSLQSSPTASPHPHHLDYSSRRPGKPSHKGGGGGGLTPWSSGCDAIIEEDGHTSFHPYQDGHPFHPYQHPADRFTARVRLCILFIILCGAIFGILILLIWVTTKPSAPQVSIKNVVFHDVYIGPGEDASGVPTSLITVNCTIQVDYSNTAKYLKAHLLPLQTELLYSKLSIAIRKVDTYTQSQKTRKVIPIQLYAARVPLYGASRDLAISQDSINQGFDLPLQITTSIQSTYYVVSKMITSKFWTQIRCNVDVNTKSLDLLSSISNACTPLVPS